jgi:RHS repeat-associated protein
MTDPLSEVWTYTFDDNHNITLVEQPNGKDVSYEYDTVNRLTGIDLLDDSSLDIEFEYDDAGRRTSMTDVTGTTTYSYDDANRLTSVTAPTTGTVSYGYNNAGQRTSLTYPSTHEVTYGYNGRGELGTVTDWLMGVTTYSYDPAGRLTGIEYPNGVTGTLDYDDADRLTAIAYADGMTALETISYVMNAVGMRTNMTDTSGSTNYTYDALYRLTEVEYPNSDVTEYGYDAVGNRTSLTINGGTPIANTYNAANELTASGSDSYSYDENGNLLSKTVNSVTTDYTWDALNRMVGLDDGMMTASYAYNGDGLRVASTVSSVTTDFTWDQTGLGSVIAGGDEYVWTGFGPPLSSITSANVATYAHFDALGGVRLLTDASGAVVGTEAFDAFGASRSQSGAQLPFSYTGEQVDAESGLVYLRARFMDPSTGQFLSRDPFPGFLNEPTSLHGYAYVANNPVRYTDPSGLCLDPGDSNPADGCGGGGSGGLSSGSRRPGNPPKKSSDGPVASAGGSSKYGGSGNLRSYFRNYNSQRDAYNAAKRDCAPGQEPRLDWYDRYGPHYHAVDSRGNPVQPNVHYKFPPFKNNPVPTDRGPGRK